MEEFIKKKEAIMAIISEPPEAHYPSWYYDKIDNLDVYKYKDKIDTLSTDINIYTNSKDIVQIEISNGYETYVIKFNNINY